MSLDSKKILGIPVAVSSKNSILEEVRKYLKNGQWTIGNSQKEKNPLVIFTPNPEIIEYAQRDSEFKKTLNTAYVNLPDGEGVVWAIGHIYKEKITRITGIDFMLDLCNLAHKENVRIGLIGGKGGVALATAGCLRTQYPGLKVEVFEAGKIELESIQYTESSIQYTSEENNELKKTIKEVAQWIEEKEIGILFVALGFPKQEYFIQSLKLKVQSEKLEKPLVLMAVGGSFDYISGKIGRAPRWMRENGLEWLYRLIKEPLRINRQLTGAKFFWKVWTNVTI